MVNANLEEVASFSNTLFLDRRSTSGTVLPIAYVEPEAEHALKVDVENFELNSSIQVSCHVSFWPVSVIGIPQSRNHLNSKGYVASRGPVRLATLPGSLQSALHCPSPAVLLECWSSFAPAEEHPQSL